MGILCWMLASLFTTRLSPKVVQDTADQVAACCARDADPELAAEVAKKVKRCGEAGGALDLKESALIELPNAAIGRLRRCIRPVQVLQVSDNRLTALPAAVCELPLVSLQAHGNQMIEAPATIGLLTKLQLLDLADNQIVTLPASICDLEALKVLLLHNNQIIELPGAFGATLPELTTLTLTSNKLTMLPAAFGGLTKLEKLALSYNKLMEMSLEYIGSISSLKQLNLSNNSLATVPLALCNLAGLEELDIHANEIRALPEALKNLQSLKKLEVSQNRMQGLPWTICELQHLESISASGNPLSNPPEVVVKRGMHAIRAHFGQTAQRRNSRQSDSMGSDSHRGSASFRGSESSDHASLGAGSGTGGRSELGGMARADSVRRGSKAPMMETRKNRARPQSTSNLLKHQTHQRQKRSSEDLWKQARTINRRIRATRAFTAQEPPSKPMGWMRWPRNHTNGSSVATSVSSSLNLLAGVRAMQRVLQQRGSAPPQASSDAKGSSPALGSIDEEPPEGKTSANAGKIQATSVQLGKPKDGRRV